MQSKPKPQPLFLEEWLRRSISNNNSSTQSSPPASAQSILQSWAVLRDPSLQTQSHHLLNSLQTLSNSQSSLHVADPQAKLLLSLLLTSSSFSPPPQSHPLLFRLLYTWLRKSPRPSPSLLESSVSLLSRLLSPPIAFPAHGILLLGTLSAVPALSEASRSVCLDLLCRLLEEERAVIGSCEELVPEVLAGIGYALTRSDAVYFNRILGFLLGIWDSGGGPRATLLHGLMILRLVEWAVSDFVNSRSLDKIEALCREISVEPETRNYVRFAIVMAGAGVLRAFQRVSSSNRLELNPWLRKSVEGSIGTVAKYLISGSGSDYKLDDAFEKRLLLQCISLGLARCSPISFSGPVLLCLCLALLNEIFPLHSFFRRAIENPNGNSAILGLNKVKEHLDSVLFKEAGAVTGVFCNQYAFADEANKVRVENYMWQYCQELYSNLRVASLVLRKKNDEFLGVLEKIAEAAFLMVVVFAAEVTKHKLNTKSSHGIQPEVSVRILVAFSCIEYLRHVRLPEYTDAVRRAVLTIQDSGAACASFVESMPAYVELTNQQGSYSLEGTRYAWAEDEVQTARMLFYLRVIPTCVSLIPVSAFGKIVAPTMFLYMQHPNEKVAGASHSVFVAFVSSGKDSDQDDRMTLKEQLVFYYIQRALEAYPGITPFEGLASGVAALVRHLPAGSPSIFFCVHSLVGKATDLCRISMHQDANMWKNWEGNSEPCKKVLELLLRLISLVDIQVLPYLLKQLAEFTVQLPRDGQNVLLDEMYSHVAESDDVTRKPVLVSWLQSLSYLCSQKLPLTSSPTKGRNNELNVGSVDALSLNTTSSRL